MHLLFKRVFWHNSITVTCTHCLQLAFLLASFSAHGQFVGWEDATGGILQVKLLHVIIQNHNESSYLCCTWVLVNVPPNISREPIDIEHISMKRVLVSWLGARAFQLTGYYSIPSLTLQVWTPGWTMWNDLSYTHKSVFTFQLCPDSTSRLNAAYIFGTTYQHSVRFLLSDLTQTVMSGSRCVSCLPVDCCMTSSYLL